jgi:hydroxyacylglutathione hydrolase
MTVIFESFYLACLSHASYLIGSEGVAAVVDPQRDIKIYEDYASEHGLKIEHIIETHLHADFVSGHRELAEHSGAKIYLGHRAGATFPHVPVHDGDELGFGRCKLKFLETPGHTVESISILVTDLDKSAEPFAVLTGDTLFIGDVGRPDLSPDKTPQELAAMLYTSLQTKLLSLADNVEVYPAHGAGSMCGRRLSEERSSTIGKERTENYALQAKSQNEFVKLLTAELPERPGYFALDAEINRAGASPLENLPPLRALTTAQVRAEITKGALVLDVRPSDQYAGAHIPGSLHISLPGQFAFWAGSLLGLDARPILLAENAEQAETARLRLSRVGIDGTVGYLAGGITSWVDDGQEVARLPQMSAQELDRMVREEAGTFTLLDVRRSGEWKDGHLKGAKWSSLDQLKKHVDDLDPSRPTVVMCKSGYRSSIACSVLERAGLKNVTNLMGGLDGWKALQLPVQVEAA